MADEKQTPLYVDPTILARDLDNSLSLASRSTTSPDDESQLREASRRLGIPLDTARSNPAETKLELERDSFDPTDYAARFPTSAAYLANPDNALVARDDVGPLSEMEKALRRNVADNIVGDLGRPNPGQTALDRLMPGYAAERQERQRVLRTEGFAAASALSRQQDARRELLRATGTIGPSRGPEATPGNILSGLGTSASVGFQSAKLGLSQQINDLLSDGTSDQSKQYNRKRAQLDSRRDLATPEFDTNLARWTYGGFASLAQTAPALGLSLATGSPALGLTLMGGQTYGEAYGRYRGRNASKGEAALGATGEATVEVLTEVLPMKYVVDRLGKAGMTEFLAGFLGRDMVGEQIATLAQDAIDTAIANPTKTWNDYLAERPEAAIQTAFATLVQAGTLAAVGEVAGRLTGSLDRNQYAADTATQNAEQLQELLAAAAASMTHKRDPQSFSQLVQDAAEDSGSAPTEIFIDANTLVDILNQGGITDEQMRTLLPSVAEQLEEAMATNGSLSIPIGEATTAFAGTGLEQQLAHNARTSPDAWTAAEAAEATDLLAQLEQDANKVLGEQTEKQAWEDSSNAVFDTLMGELNTAGRFTPDVNRTYASLVRNFYAVQAGKLGTTPQDLYARFPLTVTSRGPGRTDSTLDQYASTVTPEAKTGALTVQGVHYSAAQRPVLDGRFFGTGLKGAERARLASLPEDSPLRSRVLAYVDEGFGIRPEQGVGNAEMGVTMTNIYDTGKDPLGLWKGKDANAREQAVLDAGFSGYYVPAAMNMGGNKDMGVVAMLGEAAYAVPTTQRGAPAQAAQAPQLTEMQQALEEFRNHPELQYGSPSPETWGRFTKLKVPELYEKLAPTGIFEGTDPIYKSDLIEKMQGEAVFNQSVSLRDGRETLLKYGLDPSKKHKTRDVAAALEARQRKKYGTIERDDRSEEAAKKISKWMAEEVQFELQNPESSGAGWYSEKFQRALDSFAVEFPELATDQNARDVMTALIAITSDGQKVGPNFAQAADIYGNFRESGKFTTERGHQRQASINNNLEVLQDMHDRMGAEGMRDYLLQEATVSDLRKVAKAQGIDFDTAYQASVKLPMAAVLLGPKLGAFYANLMGAHGYLTMDRWWSRTFNRMRGVLVQKATPQGIARVRSLLGQPELSDDQVLSATVEYRNSYEAKGFKNGTELEKAANTVYKAAFEALEDAPFNASDRTFMLRSVELAQRLLKRRGNDISIADIQAILWYYEKRLYGELGARQSADISYEEAARQVVAQRGNSAGRSDLQGDGQARSESAGEGVTPGEEIFNAEGEVNAQSTREAGDRGGRYSSGSLAPLEGAPDVAGASGPDPRLVSVAEQYARDNGIDLRRQAEFAEVDPERAARIAQAYAEMRHAPNDPQVKEAYDDLIRQTRAQYDALVDAGYQFTLFDETSDPYAGNPWNAMRDLRANQRMAVYATEAGFGVGAQVNIGLADPQGGSDLNPAKVIEALRSVGAEVEVSSVYSSDTEPTLVVKIKQALTQKQGDRVSEMLGQEAIAQRTDDEQGQLFGPMAAQWGPYNPEYFVTATGDRADAIANPLLQETGLEWPDQNGVMRPVLANDLFRAVHDAFGHGLEGAGFRARGEENAWQAHVRLFTGPAVGAITTETRGQNSWLNYGPYAEQNQSAAVEDTVFAEQKTGLMPEWVWSEGRVGDAQAEVFNQSARFSEDNRLSNLSLSGPSWERIRQSNPALANVKSTDETVTVYRATIGDALRPDDFVAVDRGVAEMELENVRDRDGDGATIIEQQVPVSDLLMGNDATEFVYYPQAFNQSTGARATFNPATLEIALLEKADLSSFLHETGHFFFEMQAALAAQDGAPASIVEDMQVLLDHVGFTGTAAEWLAQPVNARREAHETIAETFEEYLFKGKAPSAELQAVFQRFRSWLISVYRSLQEMLATNKRSSLNPDVTAVFDRMLATDEAIASAQAVRQFEPMFRSAEDAGMTPEQWAGYQTDLQQQQADAIDELQARTLRDLKWLDNARGRKLKELQKEAAAQRKSVRDEVTAEVEAQPVYRAMEFLKRGITVGEDGEQIQVEVTKAAKLNITDVQAMYPEGELATSVDWKKLGYGKYGMLSDAGLHPDTVAEIFGFSSGRQLVASLLNAEPKASVIEGMTEQRMLERYGDISSPEAMIEAANEALANDARARLVATELQAVTKATGKPGVLVRAARQAAEQIVAGKPVRNLRPDLAAASANRARKAAEKAMASGDTAGAAAAKRTEILQIQLERVQRNAQKEHDKALRDFKKIFKGTAEKLSKSRDVAMVNAARAVLARYGLAPQTGGAQAQAYADLLANYDGAMAADIQSILQGLPPARDFRDLSVEQFRGMRDVVNGLYYLARRTRQMEIDGQKVEIDAVADELVQIVTDRSGGTVPPLPGYAGTPTGLDKWKASLQSAKASLTRVELWADNWGPAFKKYIWQPVSEATANMRAKRNELVAQYRDLLKAIEKGLTYNKIEAPELGATGFVFNAGKTELLHAVLHSGNQSNLTKLLVGRGWGTIDANGKLDTAKWDTFITRMINEGVLTKADFDFAQGVWDLLETVKKDAQAAHKEMYGYYFNEVTADPIQTPFGTYRGGYVPALADSISSPDMAQKREQEELLHAGNSFMFPTTGKGFTQSRVQYNRPLELDLRAIGRHLDKVSRFAYLEPTIKDVGQLVNNRRVARALNGASPGAISDMLMPWLQRTARQNASMPGKNPKMNRFFNGLRSRTGLLFMFGNVVNTLQQITGFSLAALKIPAPVLLRATAGYIASPIKMRQQVGERSPWLAERMANQSYAMQDQIEVILTNPNIYSKTVDFAQRHAYFLQQAMQNVMDPIVWTAGYDHALAKGATEKEAIRYADESVRTTQGSFAPEDISGFEVQSPFVRLFTQFYGYFNMWGNLLGNEANKAVREAGFAKASPRLLFLWFAGVAIPAFVAELIAQGLPDDEDDEDGDGILDEYLAMFFGSQAKSLATMVPIAGHLTVLAANQADNKMWNDRLNTGPAISAAESAAKGVAAIATGEIFDGEWTKNEVRSILTLIGLGTGLPVAPVSRATGYLMDVEEGRKEEPESALEMGIGITTGR